MSVCFATFINRQSITDCPFIFSSFSLRTGHHYINGLEQDCNISIAKAMEIPKSLALNHRYNFINFFLYQTRQNKGEDNFSLCYWPITHFWYQSRNDTRQHDDVIKWKHFPRYWPFVRGIQPSPLNSPHKGKWAELWCLLWSAPEPTVEQTMEKPVIWDAITPIMPSL